MSHPYLGRLVIHWCDNCNVPIVDADECGLCGAKTRFVPVTPPGDARPAFTPWLQQIRDILDENLEGGAGKILVPEDKIVLLNHASYYDRLDEIIVDGYIVAKMGYHPLKKKFEIKLTIEGGRRLAQAGLGKCVVVDEGAVGPISNGANILAVGVLSVSKGICKGDEVLVTDQKGQVLAVGVARLSGEKMVGGQGLAVRPRDSAPPKPPEIHLGGQTWEAVVNANEPTLSRYESKALNFIKNTVLKFPYKIAVAFSGGKDSLVTLLLVKKALPPKEWTVFFADTGIEFPETTDYINQVIKKYDLETCFYTEHAEDRFWSDFKTFGPPARDYRWCCKTCKLGPINELIQNHLGGELLTFIGQRRYESDNRSNEPAVSINPWVAGQIRATPIKQWVALLVWIYLLREKAPINPLYNKGYERIGCWLCPANKLADLDQLKATHPQLFQKWHTSLADYQSQHSLPDIWLTLGLWRWKTLPGSLTNLLKENKITYQHPPSSSLLIGTNLDYTLAQGITPCTKGGFSVEGHFSSSLNLEPLVPYLPILGPAQYSEELGAIHLALRNSNSIKVNLFTSGAFTIRGVGNALEAEEIAKQIGELIRRQIYCTGCGICVSHCPTKAITVAKGKIQVSNVHCNSCGICARTCPALLT